MLEADGYLEKSRTAVIQTPYGDRSGVVIEPWLTDQWYVDAHTLAQPAIEAVRFGKIKIVPKAWEKTWFNWLENIQPWCVSRQLWWGPPDSGVVRRSGQRLRRRGRGGSTGAGGGGRHSPPRPGRPRHLVLLRPLAVRHARLA
jgi:isoleucyl-tRNA synthetase